MQHAKDSVRIGVGLFSNTLIVSLPGSNDEVKISLDVLIKGLMAGLYRQEPAVNLAAKLRRVTR